MLLCMQRTAVCRSALQGLEYLRKAMVFQNFAVGVIFSISHLGHAKCVLGLLGFCFNVANVISVHTLNNTT